MGKLLCRLLIISADRRPGSISAGHYQKPGHPDPIIVMKKKQLNRCIGKHDTHLGIPGCNALTKPRFSRQLIQQQDRLLMTGKDLLLFLADLTDLLHSFHILCHHCKRLHRTPFPLPQPLYSLLTGSITAKVKTTDPFDGHDPAGSNDLPCISDSLPSPFLSSRQVYLRATVITAHRLGIIASGIRVMVLIRTGGTHGKFLHTGPFTVIRKRIQDRQSRTAAGTVDKGMQIPPVFRIKHLRLTFIADRDIRGDKDLPLCLLTFDDIKLCKFLRLLHRFFKKLQDSGTLRWLIPDICDKGIHILLLTLSKNLHIGSFIGHTATDSSCHSMTTHRRAKSHSLYDPVNTDHFRNFPLHMFLHSLQLFPLIRLQHACNFMSCPYGLPAFSGYRKMHCIHKHS